LKSAAARPGDALGAAEVLRVLQHAEGAPVEADGASAIGP
jgi:hypothetical protein